MPASQAQHVGQAPAGEPNRPAKASEPGRIRQRREWAREVLEREAAEAMIGEVRGDEPALAEELRVEPVEL